ncbi:ribosome silencing factor [candidate division WOR-3 bacterium]|uniref:Ribosomal silencing factor RsfS n=1 Tax=candidate division WOR-3 bacterium TaxID=2052148 RepID=A0A9D5KBF0_UNCW3|nr:ribosome silencing factor [candidate division WOR-3 bacterium]MBD3365627.1 ribosome silencing factor [candidate division WOR-3 bacterium]
MARVLKDKKAENIRIINVKGLSTVTEFFVFATATSTVHNRALAEEVRLKGRGEWELHHIEGVEGGDWILIDFVEVIVHLFLTETRDFYGLEQLWGDGKEVQWA